MAKVNYIKCDICDCVLVTDPRIIGFKNGYRIINRFLGRIDICDKCLGKLKKLSIDIEEERKCYDQLLSSERKYSDDDYLAAYYHGIDDAMQILSHKRLNRIR